MSNYKLQILNTERLAVIEQEWIELAGEDEFAVELEVFFRWARTHCEKTDGDGYALELRDDDAGHCAAILEVVESRRGALTKLLKLYISPQYWEFSTIEERLEIINMHASAYTELIALGIDSGAEDVKIYGRTDLMLSILKSLQEIWPSSDTGTVAVVEGRWLRIGRS